jgi:hypothetical protein
MRRELGQAIGKEFDAGMAARMPQFRQQTPDRGSGASRLYRLDGEGLTFFLSLQFHRIWDSFTLELAWSKRHRYPGSIPPDEPTEANDTAEELRFRLGKLWASPATDVWWEVRPGPLDTRDQLLEKVRPPVTDALEKVATFGQAYVNRLLAWRKRA